MMMSKSRELFDRAKKVIPGGVNSPVRAFRSVGGEPPFIRQASGSKIIDEDGNTYIDYVSSWGPMILGHAHPRVVAAIAGVLDRGTSYGAPTALEVEMAERIVKAYPSMDQVRMTSSGTEAAMGAIRLARGYTRRDKVIKFDGCYHGCPDGLLVKAGSGGMTFGAPDSAGVPADYARLTLNLPFNDVEAVRQTVRSNPGQIACIIVEPVAGNMGVVPPAPGFLEGLREISRQEGTVLIFDEVITGFRIARGGAQEQYGIVPDMTCLGKIIGGGMPVGAFGGKSDIMACLSPNGPVYQAGTLSGNPVAMTAGLTTLKILDEPGVYETLEEKSAFLAKGLQEAAREARIPVCFHRVGSMMSAFFTDQEVKDYTSARTCDTRRFARFHQEMLKRGIYLAPSQFEATFVSLAHSRDDLERTVEAARQALRMAASQT